MTRRGWWLFAVVAVLWGLPYLLIRIAVQADVAPVVVVWLRTGGAALVLLPLALHRGALHGLRARWRLVFTLTLVQVTAPFLLIAYGEQHIPSSLAGLLVAAEPLLVVVVVAVLHRLRPRRAAVGEQIDAVRLLGLVLGVGGVAALLSVDAAGSGTQLLGAGLVLLAALLYAIGALLIRRVSDSTGGRDGADPVGVITAILAINAVLLSPLALPALPDRLPTPSVTTSLIALALPCTAAAFVAYFALIAEVGPARGTVVFYATPVVTVAAGAAVLNEPLTAGTLLGLALVVAGSWLATSGRPPSPHGAPDHPARATAPTLPS